MKCAHGYWSITATEPLGWRSRRYRDKSFYVDISLSSCSSNFNSISQNSFYFILSMFYSLWPSVRTLSPITPWIHTYLSSHLYVANFLILPGCPYCHITTLSLSGTQVLAGTEMSPFPFWYCSHYYQLPPCFPLTSHSSPVLI